MDSYLITVKKLQCCEESGRFDVWNGDLVLLSGEGRVEHGVEHGAAHAQHELVGGDPLLGSATTDLK